MFARCKHTKNGNYILKETPIFVKTNKDNSFRVFPRYYLCLPGRMTGFIRFYNISILNAAKTVETAASDETQSRTGEPHRAFG